MFGGYRADFRARDVAFVRHLGLGEAGQVATGVLRGDPVTDHPRARRLEPPDSFWSFLRESASGAFLDPEEALEETTLGTVRERDMVPGMVAGVGYFKIGRGRGAKVKV